MMVNLNELVIKNNFEGIREYIQELKKDKNERWFYDNWVVNDACRDAVQLGHERIVQVFLDEGLDADIDAHKNGSSGYHRPLKYFAAKVGNLSIVKLLVNKGAKIKDMREFYDENDNQDALRAAIKKGHLEVVQYLLENGGNANGIFGVCNQTFLSRAAFDGQNLIADLLVKHGARIKDALTRNNEKFRDLYGSYNNAIFSCGDDNRAWRFKSYSETEIINWDKKKQELIEKRDALLQKYSNSVQLILDHAIGINFDKEYSDDSRTFGALTFLNDLDITGFNFVGMSIGGQPILREKLIEEGLKGAAKALVTCNDINNIEDRERRGTLLLRLEAMLQSQGKIVSKDGVYNLVPLADAAAKGHLDVVLVRLSAGINPNQETTDIFLDSYLAIVAAAKNGFSEVVRILAEHPEIDQKTRLIAAQNAKKNGHIEIYEYLSSLMDVNERDSYGNALIHKAVEARDINEIKRLLSRGADINLENGNSRTPLSVAVSTSGNFKRKLSERDINLLEFLLSNGADPNKYKGDYSPLHAAAKAGSVKALALLLPVTEKRDLKYADDYGSDKKELTIPWYAPLMFDSYGSEEWLQILSLLKEHGADLNATNRYGNETILHNFIRSFPSFTNILSQLQTLRASIAGMEMRFGPNPLQKDCENLIEEAKKSFAIALKELDFLLEKGADPRIVCGRDKQTPLHVFIEKIDLNFIEGASEQVIGRFLEYGVDVNTPDARGFTPLHEAARVDLAAAAYLISKGANVKARTKQGYTPLHLAAAGRPQATKLLIESGADVNALDENGLSPLAYSRQACIDNKHLSREKAAPYFLAQVELMRAGGE